MSGTRLMITGLQLMDPDRGIAVATATGGVATVCVAGTARKATLYNPDTGASLSNPVSLSRGKLRFAVLNTVTLVDIYGFAPDGGFFVRRNVKPGQESEINYCTDQVEHTAIIPASISDYVAATEGTTGLQFATGSILLPTPVLRVTTLDSGQTVEMGLLSSESGGDLDGFIDAVSLTTAGSIIPSHVAASLTLGALLFDAVATTPVVNNRKPYPVGATAKSVSVTFNSGTDTAEVFMILPYLKPPL